MADVRELFCNAVRIVLREWPVLKLAVQQGFGGIESQEKGQWMIDVVIQVLMENNNVEDFELEDYMAEILYNEFDTISEDGSIAKVAKKLCSLQKLWKEGKSSELEREISLAPRSQNTQIQASRMADEEQTAVDNSHQLENSSIMVNGDVTEQLGQLCLSQDTSEGHLKPNDCTVGAPGETADVLSSAKSICCDSQADDNNEEGWEVVRRTRRKR